MEILVTGGTDRYIGSILGPCLINKGQDVPGGYGWVWLFNNGEKKYPSYIHKVLRNVSLEDLKGFDALAHLAELSNEPLEKLNPDITCKINHEGSVKLANLCKDAGIHRFEYAPSWKAKKDGGRILCVNE